MTFSLLPRHRTSLTRLLYKIIPPLKAGMIVLADRYAYNAFRARTRRAASIRQWSGVLQLRGPARSCPLYISRCRSTSSSTG
jgi:hypothetical protein